MKDNSDNIFNELKSKHDWRPIPGCPGRYTLAQGVVTLSIKQLTDRDIEVSENVFPGAKDPVSFCFFKKDGLISYRKKEGFLHTLCDKNGMERKMAMLRSKKTK